jgi:recombination protein RecR
MDPIERLTSLFEKFPGIGPRQAQRFVQFLLRASPAVRRDMIDSIQSLGGSVHQCKECMRFFSGDGAVCGICANPARDKSSLAVVANDSDLLALEHSGTYRGMYFVLGGTVSLTNEKTNGLRLKQLLAALPKRSEVKEVILAFPANPEGDATGVRVREEILSKFPTMKVTSLGRGLSTGSELEYADPETIKSAFESRR